MIKQTKITNAMQEVAADILGSFIMYTWDGVTEESCSKFYDDVYKAYGLNDDPFTHFPCSNKEYVENYLKYQQQTMIEQYGHCDGIE